MGNLGFQPLLSRPSCEDRDKAATSDLNATHHMSDNENVHHRQTYGGIPMSHPEYPHTWHKDFSFCLFDLDLFVRIANLLLV